MPDPSLFETRLSAALRRYADQVPTDVDALELVRRTGGAIRPRAGHRVGVRHMADHWLPGAVTLRRLAVLRILAVIVIMALAVALGAALFVAGALRPTQSPAAAAFPPGSIAFVPRGGPVYVADHDGAHAVEIAPPQPGEGWNPVISFSPDRRHLAFMRISTSGGRLVIVSPDGRITGSVSLPLSTPVPWELQFSWAPDGQRLATYTPDDPGRLVIVGVAGTRLSTIALPEGAGGRESYGAAMLPWSPDGHWVAVRNGQIAGYLLVATDGSGSRPLVTPSLASRVETNRQFMAWSPDSRIALNQWDPARVEILSPEGTAFHEVPLPDGLNAVASPCDPLAWSPSGDRIVVVAVMADQSAEQLVVIDKDFSVHVVPRDPLGPAECVAWSADGQRLLYSSNAGLWSVSVNGGVATQLVDGTDVSFDVADGMP